MLTNNQQIFEQIKKASNILITFNKIWSGDAIASALALYLFLSKMEKNVDIVAEKFAPGEQYSFLPGYQKINFSLDNLRRFVIALDTTRAKADKIKYQVEDDAVKFIVTPREGFFTDSDVKSYVGEFKYDLIITLDTPDLESLGAIYEHNSEFFYKVPLINIDHKADNESYGQINLVELPAIATAEIIFDLMAEYSRDMIDEDIATSLLAGIISKTKSFKTQNLTPHALSISAQLISLGGRREEIVNRLYRSRSLNVLKLWGRVLARLVSSMDNKLVWTVLTQMDFEKTGTYEEDLGDVIDELIVNIPNAKIIVILYEIPAGRTDQQPKDIEFAGKAVVYSLKNINALSLVKDRAPSGNKNLATINIRGNIVEAEKEIIESIKEALGKIDF